jgi:hypothetical protein
MLSVQLVILIFFILARARFREPVLAPPGVVKAPEVGQGVAPPVVDGEERGGDAVWGSDRARAIILDCHSEGCILHVKIFA